MTTIVIFGAAVLSDGRPSPTLLGRVQAAFACGGTDAHYMPTGAVGRHGPSEASVMAGLLVGWGVPRDHLHLEETATDTLSSAVACARLLASRPGPVRIVSSGYHVRRCQMLMRMAGVAATVCPPPPIERRIWYWRLRECAALPYDAVAMSFRIALGVMGESLAPLTHSELPVRLSTPPSPPAAPRGRCGQTRAA